jgi:hypothetical protein
MASVEEANVELRAILSKIQEGLSLSERSGISDELVRFAARMPARAEYAELTQTAIDTSDTLDRAITKTALKNLKSRTASLIRYVTAINAVTNRAKQDAAEACLETVQKILEVTKSVTKSANDAKKALEEGNSNDGIAAIEKILEEIDKLT